ncbi:MAG TPA: RNA polymerase sigma-70 factor [Niabella sp.]|nr:RNA polymerase sigma-70 factor [Niabella sp.]
MNRIQFADKDLLQQVAGGSEAAFQQLFDHFRSKLYTYAHRLTRSQEEAEDTIHDVFLKIWERRERLTEISSFDSYLFRMAHNHIYNGFQRRNKETLILAVLEKEQSESAISTAEDRLLTADVKKSIDAAIEKLTPHQRQVFLLSRQQGFSHEEIAGQLNIALQTVKNHITSSLRTIREELGKEYGSLAVAIFVLYNIR